MPSRGSICDSLYLLTLAASSGKRLCNGAVSVCLSVPLRSDVHLLCRSLGALGSDICGSVCAMIRGRRIDADCRSVLGYSRCDGRRRAAMHAGKWTAPLVYWAIMRVYSPHAGPSGISLAGCGKRGGGSCVESSSRRPWPSGVGGGREHHSLTARRGPARLSLLLSRLERWAIVLEELN